MIDCSQVAETLSAKSIETYTPLNDCQVEEAVKVKTPYYN